jgi:DNA-binding IclR family transcriptional regulator
VQLAVLDHPSVLYIRILESRQQVRMSSTVGSRAPAHCTAVGKALLAFQPAEQAKQIIENGLRRFTANTITDPERLLEELGRFARGAFAVDDEESEMGPALRRRAYPGPHGLVSAAISVSAPVQRMTKKNLQTMVPTVVAAADAISRRLGYLPSPAGAHIAE